MRFVAVNGDGQALCTGIGITVEDDADTGSEIDRIADEVAREIRRYAGGEPLNGLRSRRSF
jgi:hypothetical protein